MLFSRRKKVKEMFEKYCKDRTEQLRKEEKLSKFQYVSPEIETFLAWLETSKEGKEVVEELYKSVHEKME
jgi:hypothetical protein